jgi:hypothetical protein
MSVVWSLAEVDEPLRFDPAGSTGRGNKGSTFDADEGQTARRCTTIGIAIRLPLFLIGMGQEKYRTFRRHWNRGVVLCWNCGAGH